MITQRDTSNTLRTPTVWTQRDAGGTLRTLTSIWQRDAGNILRQVYAAGGSTGGTAISPSYVQGYGSSKASIRVTTGAVVATCAGTSPFTVVWNFDDTGWGATSPASLSTTFRSPSIAPGDFSSTYGRAIITDSIGRTFRTDDVEMFAANNYQGVQP